MTNRATKEIVVVYDGPPLSGRRTSVEQLLLTRGQRLDPYRDTYGIDVEVDGRRYPIRIQLLLQRDNNPVGVATSSGLERDRTWLIQSDGVVFVADSQPFRMEENLDRVNRLRGDLQKRDVSCGPVSVIYQVNKRDLPSALPMDRIISELRADAASAVESTAVKGLGVEEALRALVRAIVVRYDE